MISFITGFISDIIMKSKSKLLHSSDKLNQSVHDVQSFLSKCRDVQDELALVNDMLDDVINISTGWHEANNPAPAPNKEAKIEEDYKSLIKSSLIDVIKHALKKTSEYGISNGHHFYITFDTTNPKNQIPEYLKKDYPKTMMIVIENEFWNLKVEQEYFSVDLKFKGKIDHLKINFSSLKTFVDPSVSFTLNLDIEDKVMTKKPKNKTKVLKKKQLENKSNVIFLKPKNS